LNSTKPPLLFFLFSPFPPPSPRPRKKKALPKVPIQGFLFPLSPRVRVFPFPLFVPGRSLHYFFLLFLPGGKSSPRSEKTTLFKIFSPMVGFPSLFCNSTKHFPPPPLQRSKRSPPSMIFLSFSFFFGSQGSDEEPPPPLRILFWRMKPFVSPPFRL